MLPNIRPNINHFIKVVINYFLERLFTARINTVNFLIKHSPIKNLFDWCVWEPTKLIIKLNIKLLYCFSIKLILNIFLTLVYRNPSRTQAHPSCLIKLFL